MVQQRLGIHSRLVEALFEQGGRIRRRTMVALGRGLSHGPNYAVLTAPGQVLIGAGGNGRGRDIRRLQRRLRRNTDEIRLQMFWAALGAVPVLIWAVLLAGRGGFWL